MNKITSTLASLFLLGGLCHQAQADSSVWKVSKDSDYIYLAGTVHILPPSEFPLPKEFDIAYANTDAVILETELPAEGDTAFQAKMMKIMTYSQEKTLRDYVSKKTYSQLEAYATEMGASMVMLERFKPGLLLTIFTMMEVQRAGLKGEGVDAYFDKLAKKDGKKLEYLETIDFQLNMIANMGEGNEDKFLLQNLEEFKDFKPLLLKLIAAWRSGDMNTLNTIALEPMKKDPQSMKQLLTDRNNNWIPLIDAMFTDDDKELVMVGAAHLVGEQGVITLLENKGYKITQVSGK